MAAGLDTPHSWIILTMGDRPAEVAAAVASIRAQAVVPTEVIVVGNGVDPGPVPGARTIALDHNLGVSGGRNAGAAAAEGDVLLFLDDDARCVGDDLSGRVLRLLDQRPEVAAVAMRIVDTETGVTQRRHVPRLRAGDPSQSSDVTTFLGGACAVRAADFRAVGGYPDAFFYAMEETDLAWALLDRGRRIHYLADAVVHHPATVPARHGRAFTLTARNRVWLARRRLPFPIRIVYVGVWGVLMVARAPSRQARRDVLTGLRQGWREAPTPASRIGWRTVLTMTRLGRPPVI